MQRHSLGGLPRQGAALPGKPLYPTMEKLPQYCFGVFVCFSFFLFFSCPKMN